jgi:signal transduction histidine kinase
MGEKSSNSSNISNKESPRENNALSSDESGADQRIEHLVDELKKRSAQLEEANRELRRVSHYRSLFLARMSHELRTPLTSILGFSEILLEQEQLTEAQRRFCQKIRDSGFQLQSSLNQLVDLSRVEAGKTELFLQEFSLREVLRESCAAVARIADKQQVAIEYDLAPDLTTVVSDQGKLRQILYNFLAWSVSRSKGGQTVSVYAKIVEPSLLYVLIKDNGEPIKDLSHVFEPQSLGSGELGFEQLGTMIGRRLLEMMGGTVALASSESGGVSTTIELPARGTKG